MDISGMDNHGRVLGAIYDNGGHGGFRHGGMMFDGKDDTIEVVINADQKLQETNETDNQNTIEVVVKNGRVVQLQQVHQ